MNNKTFDNAVLVLNGEKIPVKDITLEIEKDYSVLHGVHGDQALGDEQITVHVDYET